MDLTGIIDSTKEQDPDKLGESIMQVLREGGVDVHIEQSQRQTF